MKDCVVSRKVATSSRNDIEKPNGESCWVFFEPYKAFKDIEEILNDLISLT
jgi:hypothetical protein